MDGLSKGKVYVRGTAYRNIDEMWKAMQVENVVTEIPKIPKAYWHKEKRERCTPATHMRTLVTFKRRCIPLVVREGIMGIAAE